jgi:hypothetical protein
LMGAGKYSLDYYFRKKQAWFWLPGCLLFSS